MFEGTPDFAGAAYGRMEPAQALPRMLAAPINVITNYGPAITNAAAKGLKR